MACKRTRFIFILLFFISLLAACCIGRFPLTLEDIFTILLGTAEDAMKQDVLLKIRLPRLLFAGVSGAALAVSGMVYQELFHNPLVSPDVLGVSGGACVGAAGAILFGAGTAAVQAGALAGGVLAVLLSCLLSWLIGRRGGVSLLLAGIVIKALMDAVLMTIKYMADPSTHLPAIDYWLMGSFHTVRWAEVRLALPLILACLLLLWLLRYRIQVLSLGEEEAASLGLSVRRLKGLCILAATLTVAAAASVTGVVTWVGLIVPHGMRLIAGERIVKHFGLCALGGAVFLIWADTLARSLSAAEIPVSILTSLAGAVFLFALLTVRKYRRENS